jgi:hypothetical protein
LRLFAKLRDGALALGIDAETSFANAARFAQPQTASLMLQFAHRDPGGRMF